MIERLIVGFLRWRNRRRHRKCLARIARLELELFPPPPPTKLERAVGRYEFGPGARWLVEEPTNYTQMIYPQVSAQVNLQRAVAMAQQQQMGALAARGLAHSAAMTHLYQYGKPRK